VIEPAISFEHLTHSEWRTNYHLFTRWSGNIDFHGRIVVPFLPFVCASAFPFHDYHSDIRLQYSIFPLLVRDRAGVSRHYVVRQSAVSVHPSPSAGLQWKSGAIGYSPEKLRSHDPKRIAIV
jgi:hypothetical protein